MAIQVQAPDDSNDPSLPVKKPLPVVGTNSPTSPTPTTSVPPDPTATNDPSLQRTDYTDGGAGGASAQPAPTAAAPTPSITPTNQNTAPTDMGGQQPITSSVTPLQLPSDAQAPAATSMTPSGMSPDQASWWNSSGLPSFQNIFQQNFGRQATPQEIDQYGAKVAGMSWDDVPGMLRAAGVQGAPAPSGTMGSGDASTAIAPAPIQTEGPGQAPSTPTPVPPATAPPLPPQLPAPGGTMGSGNPVATPLALPSVGSAFGPGNDLRYTQINPTPSARTTAAQAATDAAAGKVAGFDPNAQTASNIDQFGKDLSTPDVGFTGVDTNVSRTAVDPNIAFNGVGTNVGAGPAVDPNTSAALAAYQAQQAKAAAAVGNGANRQQLAEQNLEAFDQAQAPGIQDAIRSVGQRASALGRIGNGQTSVEALKPYTDYLTQRAAMSKQLAADAAAGDIQDRQNNLTAAEGLVGSTAAQDASVRGEQRTERSNVQDTTAANLARQVAERNASLGVAEGNRSAAQQEADAQAGIATGNVSRAMDQNATATQNAQANAARDAAARATAVSQGINATDATGSNLRSNAAALSGAEGQSTAEDQASADALRNERSYQDQIAQQATEAAIQQHLIEQSDNAQRFGQNATMAQIGESGNPANAYLNAAGQSGATAGNDYAGLQQLLQQYLSQQPPQQRAG